MNAMNVHLRAALSMLIALAPANAWAAQVDDHEPDALALTKIHNTAEPARTGLDLVDPAAVGMSEDGLRAVDDLIENAIAHGVTPGAAIAVGRLGRLVRLRGYGRLDWDPEAAAVDEHSIFDVASLTKPVVTATAVMLLMREKRFDLDAPLATYLPEFIGADDRSTMTARHLLSHRSGLPAGGPLSGARDREEVPEFMSEVRLRSRPGARYVYSDYGAILLGVLVERVAGQPLDAFIRDRIFEPLGLADSGFNPMLWPWNAAPNSDDGSASHLATEISTLLDRIAPTERTRRGHLRGVVHDPLAARLGGIAGHAGLFSSARDLAVFAQMILDHGRSNDRALVDSSLVARFTRPVSRDAHYGLGWAIARPDGPSGDLFSPRSFGHTGFTGTSLWIDPDQDLFVVLLTNRVNPTAREHRHIALRRDVHDAVQRAIVGR